MELESHTERLLALAAAEPGARAVSDPDGVLSYSELVERAASTADDLLSHGLQAGDPVIVSLERSRFHVSTVVGVALAGGVYVPLDPEDPLYRQRLIAESSGACFAVGDSTDRDKHTLTVLEQRRSRHSGRKRSRGRSENIAYILFTSGSTGTPKGVEIEDSCLDAFLVGSREWAGVTPHDVVACWSAFTFDISIWEIWGALTFGAELFVVPRVAQLDAGYLLRLLEEHGVSMLAQTPTALRQLAARVSQHGTPSQLRGLIVAGERLDFAWLRPFGRVVDNNELTVWNLYGTTETTVFATGRVVTAEDIRAERRSLIGSALPHAIVEVLAPDGSECAMGIVGEIVISGQGVGLGYRGLDDPRFIRRCGVRSFFSGDLGRYTQGPHGREIEFIGRADGFLKVRGYRVEPDEVAATLILMDDVEDAAAVDVSFLPGGEAIAAAVILRRASTVTEKGLRSFLGERLPHYARPARIVEVEHLPRLSSGKLDRAALRVQIESALVNDGGL